MRYNRLGVSDRREFILVFLFTGERRINHKPFIDYRCAPNTYTHTHTLSRLRLPITSIAMDHFWSKRAHQTEPTMTGWKIIYPFLVCVFCASCVCLFVCAIAAAGDARKGNGRMSERIVTFAPMAFTKILIVMWVSVSLDFTLSHVECQTNHSIHYHTLSFDIVTGNSYPLMMHFTVILFVCYGFHSCAIWIIRIDAGTNSNS